MSDDLAGLQAELERLKGEVADLRRAVDANTPRPLPFLPTGITDRDGVAQQVLNDRLGKPPYALGVWIAAVQAKKLGIETLQVFEFGVAHGQGLLSLCRICEAITRSTDLKFEIFGFDSDVGMPPLRDYRDHPEIWREGQFLSDHDGIRAKLPAHAQLISGNIGETLPAFVRTRLGADHPVGFVSIDVDLYSSTKQCLPLLEHPDRIFYLPTTMVYFDDINDQITNNDWTGEELAIREFNLANRTRKLQEMRVRQNHPPRGWHDQLYGLHVLDHPARTGEMAGGLLHEINHTAM